MVGLKLAKLVARVQIPADAYLYIKGLRLIMKKALVFFLLLSFALAQSIDVSNVGYANITLKISGYAPTEQVVYVPTDDIRQRVEYPQGLNVYKDKYGNNLMNVTGRYSYTFNVLVDASKPYILRDESFPSKQRVFEEYLTDSTFIIASDLETKQKALDITTRSETMLEATKDLALWVNDYVKYNPKYSLSANTLSSVEVLKYREGVCGEFSNLYAALARSLSISTRIATGLVYTGTKWQRHGWTESFVGGIWIPIDPTFGEIGTMNALHVKLYAAPTYLYYMHPEAIEEVEVMNFTTKPFNLPLEINASIPDRIAPRSIFYIRANITNTGTTILMPTYYAQKTVGVEALDEFRKTLLLEPGETEYLEWAFVSPYGERERYYVFFKGPNADYTFPLNIDTSLVAQNISLFKIKSFFSRVEDDELVIEANIKNMGNQDVEALVSVTTSLGTASRAISLKTAEEKLVDFRFPALSGRHDFEIKVEAGETKENAFGVAFIPLKEREETFKPFIQSFMPYLYVLIIIIVLGGLALVLFVPSIEGPKPPFHEKEEWTKLMKLREQKP